MASVQDVYQYPLPTWIENLAVTRTNALLVSFLTAPELHFIDPSASPPTDTIIHSFAGDGSGLTGVLGIAELQTDVFAFVAGQIPQTATPGNYSIWSADLRPGVGVGKSVVEKIADVPGGELLNGMAKVDERTLLVADSMKGVIWRVDLESKESTVVLDDESLKPGLVDGSFVKAGVNGLRVHDSYAYFSNSAQGTLSRVKIDSQTGAVEGEIESLADGMLDADDFAIAKDGRVFVTRNTADIVEVGKNGVKVAVKGVSTENVKGPTSAAFGRGKGEKNVLYVSTIGRVNGTFVEGGKVVAIRI